MSTLHRKSFTRALEMAALLVLSGLLSYASGQTGKAAVPPSKSPSLIIEPDFEEVATIAPSFAGFFYSSPESDTLVVAVADTNEGERARTAVLRVLARKRNPLPYKALVIRRVNYSLIDLSWWQTLVEKKLLALPQVTLLDVNEGSNTIEVGVSRNSEEAPVHAVMRSSAVPQNAYQLVVFAGCRQPPGCALRPQVIKEGPPSP